MKAELVTTPNGDLKVVNAARVSFAKESLELSDGDRKLLKYLAEHKHWSPFAHAQEVFDIAIEPEDFLSFLCNANLAGFRWYLGLPDETYMNVKLRGSLLAWIENHNYLPVELSSEIASQLNEKYFFSWNAYDAGRPVPMYTLPGEAVLCTDEIPDEVQYSKLQTVTLRMKTPIFVARQLVKHQQDLVWNEVSRRYVTDNIEFFMPDVWKGAPENKKQGADASVEISQITICENLSAPIEDFVSNTYSMAEDAFETLLADGVAPEQARMVLPLSLYTEWYWTGSLDAMQRIVKDRLGPGAQGETTDAVRLMVGEIAKAWPVSWDRLMLEQAE